jgi:hypothetical protein
MPHAFLLQLKLTALLREFTWGATSSGQTISATPTINVVALAYNPPIGHLHGCVSFDFIGRQVNHIDLEDETGAKERCKAAVQEAVTVATATTTVGIRPSMGIEVLDAVLNFRVYHAREAIREYA